MPLLEPRQDETADQFRGRCMSDETMASEYPDQNQRLAVCESQWANRTTAAGPDRDTLTLAGQVTLEAKTDKPVRVEILAYNGGVITPSGGWGPVAIDLMGLAFGDRVPLLADHRAKVSTTLGTGTAHVRENKLYVFGVLSLASPAARQLVQMHQDGVRWSASVGLEVEQTERLRAGNQMLLNGRSIKADKRNVTILRRARLREVSLLPMAADTESIVHIHAKGQTMSDSTNTPTPDFIPGATTPDSIQAMREQEAVEMERIGKIRKLTAGGHEDIGAQAIREGWNANETELAVLRASRPKGPAIHTGGVSTSRETLEAATLMHLGFSEVAKNAFDERTLEAADNLGIVHALDIVKQAVGLENRPVSSDVNTLLATGFTTASLSGILGDSARKIMQQSYRQAPSAARKVAKKLTASDFKQHTGYRLTGDFKMEELGAAGELKHATIDEESFTYQAKTYGRIFSVTRTMMINDDLGAFAEIPRMIGRGAALALEDAFWTLVLANTGNFFSAGNGNYVTGSTYVLGDDGLAKAVETLRKQTDADGNHLLLEPKYLVVPPELEATGRELLSSRTVVIAGSTDATRGAANVWQGLADLVVSPYLSDSDYTGYSTTAYYLLAGPGDVACFGVAYLNGVEAPTIEDAPLRSDVLGKAWRGYFDFGVCQVDKRGGVKMKGAD